MDKGRVLIVDADIDRGETLRLQLEPLPLKIQMAAGAEAAIQLLSSSHFHAVLCDLGKDGDGGREVLRAVRTRDVPTPVILLNGHAHKKEIEEYLAAGAFELVSHTIDRLSLVAVVRRALLRSGLMFEEPLYAPLKVPLRRFPFLVGTSPPMTALLRQIAKVAAVDSTVCVFGESGTGKELVARAIHYASRRANRPMIVFDCAATAEGLIESELFGHVKGAFTSAVAARDGVFQLADGGTVFMDEIGELSLSFQAKILRVVQSREFRKVGSDHSTKVDVRIIAATNKDLRAMVAAGTFREDLFYRLEVLPLTLPPLRQHKEDIPLFVDHFLDRFNRTNPKQIEGVSSGAMAALLRYPWPGNVRELENCIEHAAVMCDGKILDVDDIALVLRPMVGALPMPPSLGEESWPRSLKEARKDAEREFLLKALQSVNGNRTRAAELLGISLRGLHYRLKGVPPADIPPVASNGTRIPGEDLGALC